MISMPRYTLRQLEYLVTSAEFGSIAKAAGVLNVSQPSISTGIAKLEDVLGIQLLVRHHALGISLTPAGQRLITDARNLLQHSQEIERQARRAGEQVAGSLQLASFITLAPAFLPGLISGFKLHHKDVTLEITEGTQNDLFEGLRNSRFELALLYDVSIPGDIRSVPLAKVQPYALLPTDHGLATADKLFLKDLIESDMVLLDVPPSREYFLSLFAAQGLQPKIAFSSPSLELVRGLVGRGLGFSLLVTRPHGDMSYDGQKLVARKLADDVEPGRIALASLAQLRPTRLMSVFEQFCIEFFKTPLA
jgi:DNA-binding transcriptional LysR family regulator